MTKKIHLKEMFPVQEESGTPVEWDFDIAFDTFDEEYLRYLADQYGIEITEINPEGPGGGNPQVFAKARDMETARRFMKGIYGDQEGYTDGDYGLPEESVDEAAEGEIDWNNFEEFMRHAINHADDIGIKQRVWNSPQFEEAAKKAFADGERDPFMWVYEYQRESQAWKYGKNESIEEAKGGDFEEWFQAVYDYADVNLGINGRTLGSPAFLAQAKKAFESGEDPYTFMTDYITSHHEYTFGEGMDESHGEREASKSIKSLDKKWGKRSKMSKSDKQMDVDDLQGFGDDLDDDGFGQDQQFLTGVEDRGEFDGRGGFSAGEEGGLEDPTSSKVTSSPGPSGEDFGDPPEEQGFGPDVELGLDPEDYDSQWDDKGRPVNQDSDVRFSTYDEDEDTFVRSNWDPYWDSRDKAKREDDLFEPIRSRRGEQGPKGLNPRRKPSKH